MELLNFIRTGEFTKSKPTVQSFILLLITYLIFVIPISIPLIILNAFDLIPEHISQKEDATLKLLLVITILGPIVEELIFRLFLVPKKIFISISISVICVTIAKSLWGENYWYEWYLLTLPTSAFVYYILRFIKSDVKIPIRYLVHISVISFAFMHIFNFLEVKTWMYFIFPILTVPQILMGYILSFTRLKYGFLFGVLLHMIINFTVSLPLIIKYIYS